MEIRVYSPELVFLGVIENFRSLLWYRKYYEPGRFELYAPATDENMRLLKAGNIITKRGAVEAGIIGEYEDEEGSDATQITRKGYFMSHLTARRIIQHTHTFNGTHENAMRYLVQQATPIPRLQVGAESGIPGSVSFQVSWKNLETYLTKLAKCSGLGYRIRPDFREKKLVFEVYAGIDHTTQQNENARVVFSKQFDNLNDVKYTRDDNKVGTVFYIAGEGEGADRVVTTLAIGATSGLDLHEVFIDAKDIRKDEDTTDEEYIALLQQRGLEKAADYGIKESIEAEVADVNFIYKRDWDLGDIVTVRKSEWGITLHERVTEVQETYENGGVMITPTFGDALPETIDLSED